MIEFLIWFAAGTISTFGVVYLFYKLLGISFYANKYRTFILVLISYIVAYMQFYDLKFVNLVTYFIFYPLYFLNYTKIDLKNILINIIIIWLVGGIFDFIFMIILSLFLCNIIHIDLNMVWYVLFATILINMLFLILGESKRFVKFVNRLVIKLHAIIFVDILLLFFILFLFYVGVLLFHQIEHFDVSLLLLIIIVLSIFSFFVLISLRLKNVEMKIFLKTLKNNNDAYLKIMDEFKIFKHNFNNRLLAIKSVSNKEASVLVDDLLNNYNKNVRSLVKFEEIPYGLNGVIYEKIYLYLNELDIKINNSINEDIFDLLKPSQYNVLVEKFGILIDNAISASLLTDEKLLQIDIYVFENCIYAKVINTFSSTIDIDLLGTKFYSTNNDVNRGLGLFSIIRNNNVSLSIEVISDKFISTLKVKINT